MKLSKGALRVRIELYIQINTWNRSNGVKILLSIYWFVFANSNRSRHANSLNVNSWRGCSCCLQKEIIGTRWKPAARKLIGCDLHWQRQFDWYLLAWTSTGSHSFTRASTLEEWWSLMDPSQGGAAWDQCVIIACVCTSTWRFHPHSLILLLLIGQGRGWDDLRLFTSTNQNIISGDHRGNCSTSNQIIFNDGINEDELDFTGVNHLSLPIHLPI